MSFIGLKFWFVISSFNLYVQVELNGKNNEVALIGRSNLEICQSVVQSDLFV